MPVVRLFFVLLLVNAIAFMLLEGWLGSSSTAWRARAAYKSASARADRAWRAS